MMRKKYLITVCLLVFFVPAIVGYLVFQRSGRCARIQCVSFLDKNQYALSEIYEETPNAFRALFRHGSIMLRVDVRSNTSPSDAQILTDGFLAQTKGLYENTRSPYPGDVSNEIVCSKEFIPQFATAIVDGVHVSHFSAYLTSRLTYGACVADLASYKGTTATFYCPGRRQLMIFEWMVPKEQAATLPDALILAQSISCK